jgi:pimeloyl-ACP methyl ester carboxylesterase
MRRRIAVHAASAVVTATVLVALAASTRLRPTPPRHAARVRAGSLTLRYVRAGRGTPIVLVHGFGESLVSWQSVFDRLAGTADVIAIDLPGFGLSSKPPTGYATDSLAADLLRALRALRIERAVLVGHSLGGAVVVAAALADPGRVRAVVLLDAALVGVPGPAAGARQGDSAGRSVSPAIAEYEAFRTRFTAPHAPGWMAESDSALAYVPADDPAYRVAVEAVLREFDFAYLTDERAARWHAPTLVLWGQYDQLFSLATGRLLAARLPQSRFQIIPRSWHRPHVERPAETAGGIARFVAGLEPVEMP